jgi:hypothetical protein
MIARWAVVQHGSNVVDNIVEWDGESEWVAPLGYYLVLIGDQRCDLAWTYDPETHEFIGPPEPPLPPPEQ